MAQILNAINWLDDQVQNSATLLDAGNEAIPWPRPHRTLPSRTLCREPDRCAQLAPMPIDSIVRTHLSRRIHHMPGSIELPQRSPLFYSLVGMLLRL
jgi:hypothetical protein